MGITRQRHLLIKTNLNFNISEKRVALEESYCFIKGINIGVAPITQVTHMRNKGAV